MKEIRYHGLAGHGIVLGAKILAEAFLAEGKYVATFPMYGTARRGSPVSAFVRFDNKPIKEKCQVYFPDCLLVAEPSMLSSSAVFGGLKADGILVINTPHALAESPHENLKKVGILDATGIALEETGSPVANIPLVAGFAAATGWLTLDSFLTSLKGHFSGEGLERNIRAAKRGFGEIMVKEYRETRDAV